MAFEHNLTTLDFNAIGLITRMSNFLLRPVQLRGARRNAPIEIESMIIQRKSVGKIAG